MSEKSEIESARFCILMCWVAGIVGGLIVAVIAVKALELHALAGLFLGFLAALALAFLFYWLFCDEKKDAEARKANAWVDPDKLPDAAELTDDEVAETTPEVTESDVEAPVSKAAPAIEEIAEAPAAEVEPEASAEPEVPAAPASGAGQETAAPETKSIVQSSKPLAGEEELASRKGEWRYGDKPTTSQAEEPVTEAAPAVEGEGTQPKALTSARESGADNLKEIKGVGPKLEKLLNSLGIYHFDQIADWTADEVVWMDGNLKGFKGRVSRDTWVDQAKTLASGEETEFSKRVDDGDVY